MDQLFLETTGVAERIFGVPETIKFINSVCEAKTLLSSTYVWGEFRRTFLNDSIICHQVFVNSFERGDDFATALKRLTRFSGMRYKPRKLRRAIDVIARLHEKPFDSLKEAIERLENDILYSLELYFFCGLNRPLIKGADCQMTASSPKELPATAENQYPKFELFSRCTKEDNPNCNVISFWKGYKPDLKAVVAMEIPSSAKGSVLTELQEFRNAAKVILENLDKKPSEAYGKRCFAKIADLIICLECPPNTPIITSNRQHYIQLCATLGRPEPVIFQP